MVCTVCAKINRQDPTVEGVLDKNFFDGALHTLLRQSFGPDWQEDAGAIEIQVERVWELLHQLELTLGYVPVKVVTMCDMTIAQFVINMTESFGFA